MHSEITVCFINRPCINITLGETTPLENARTAIKSVVAMQRELVPKIMGAIVKTSYGNMHVFQLRDNRLSPCSYHEMREFDVQGVSMVIYLVNLIKKENNKVIVEACYPKYDDAVEALAFDKRLKDHTITNELSNTSWTVENEEWRGSVRPILLNNYKEKEEYHNVPPDTFT